MPHKLSKQEIIDAFSNDFEIESIENSVFHGTLELKLKALFVVLKKKSIWYFSKLQKKIKTEFIKLFKKSNFYD